MALVTETRDFLDETGSMAKFTGHFFSHGLRPRFEIKELLSQCYIIGYKSFPLIALTGFIMGLVLTMQLRPSLVSYGVQSELAVMVGIAIVREIGPVITALIFA
jgi:phospholipid/cholesterol/gamma-HCH transport system permease protein